MFQDRASTLTYPVAIRVKLLFALWSIYCLLSSVAFANSTRPLEVELSRVATKDLGGLFSFYEDTANKETIDSIRSPELQSRFVPLAEAELNRGYSASTFWLKVQIANRSDQHAWHIISDSPLLEFTTFLEYGSSGAIDVIPATNRGSKVSRLYLPEGSENTIYLKVYSNHVLDLGFHLYDQIAYEDHIGERHVFYSAYLGIAIALFIYNAFVYFTLKDKNYLYYLIFAVVNTHLNLLAVNFPGVIYELFGWNWWEITPYYRPMAPLTLFIFTRVLFHTKLHHPRLDKVLLAYMFGIILLSLSNIFFDKAVVSQWSDAYFMVGILLSFGAGFVSLSNKSAPSLFYLLAISAFTVGMGVYLLAIQNILPTNFYTMISHMVGHSAELILMSLALAQNIKMLQLEVVTSSYQKELANHSKFSSIGMMAGGLAHELSNPLAIVVGQIRIAKHLNAKGDREQVEARLTSAIEGSDRMGRIIQAVRNLYEGSKLAADHYFRFDDAIHSILKHFQERLRSENVELQLDLHPLIEVKAHPTHIEIVFRILLDNALDAMRSVESKRVEIRQELTKKGLTLRIADSGPGMNDETKAKVFDPFFTTKDKGKGMGLGLTLAHTIVHSYGWTIEVKSKPGRTEFIIEMPNGTFRVSEEPEALA